MKERRLPGAQPAALEDVGPDGEERFRNRAGGDQIDTRRDRKTLLRGRHAHRRVTAARHERAHRVADLPLPDVGADGGDRAGHLETGDVARAGRRRIRASTLKHVRPVHAGAGDSNENFLGTRHRIRTLDRHEHLGTARTADLDADHSWSDPAPAAIDAGDDSNSMAAAATRAADRTRPSSPFAPPDSASIYRATMSLPRL